ncbi:MAG: hypothetical protein QXE84_06040 [Candidatus Nitrosotenuis sp.]|nr:hypothetical protein [Candidatus Nitrosotenuis uzonensis]MCA2003162.1 hypothetical protein [Candidatus Nitrosotenuis sp.]CAE6493704.1 conserved hypothetical protein [Candidatus Nitrosotenuis uzonensis]
MDESEKRLKQEDCNEDTLGAGILTLTNKRIAFDKTRGRIADFTKKIGDTVLDVQLGDITKVWKEGLLIKKVCFTAKTAEGEKTFKFGVFNTGSWQKDIQNAIDSLNS